MTETPDWLTVGAAVASVSIDRNARSVRTARIYRIGKRDVVLDNGERFNVNSLERRSGDTWSIRYTRLMRPDDPKVKEIRDEIRHANLVTTVKKACEEFRYAGSVRGSTVTAADVILALAPLTGVADEIAALFATNPPPDNRDPAGCASEESADA